VDVHVEPVSRAIRDGGLEVLAAPAGIGAALGHECWGGRVGSWSRLGSFEVQFGDGDTSLRDARRGSSLERSLLRVDFLRVAAQRVELSLNRRCQPTQEAALVDRVRRGGGHHSQCEEDG
jgi:hypothetical protein